MSDRLDTFRDKLARVLPLLESQWREFTSFVMGRPPTPKDTTRNRAGWSGEAGLYYDITGRHAGRFYCYGESVGGDLIDFYARYYLHRPDAKGEALKGAMQWLGLSDDAPIPDAGKAAQRRKEREERLQREEAKAASEAAKKAVEAARIFDSGSTPAGSPGALYAARRAIHVESWPPAVRWIEEKHALAFAVTDDSGAIHALQFVAVTTEGRKDEDRAWIASKPEEKRAKHSFGPIGAGVVRLTGSTDYLLLAEGPESALTAWAATGFETWACLGGMKRAVDFNIGKRPVVVLRDDDAVTSGGYRAAVKAVNELRAASHEVVEVWPFEQHRGNGDDINDLAQEAGVDAVRQRIEQTIARHRHARFELPLEKAQERMAEIAKQFFTAAETWDKESGETPPVHAVGVSVGTGKSHAAIEHGGDFLHRARNRDDQRAIVYAVPEHRLSDEIAQRFTASAKAKGYDLRAAIWRGREALRPGGMDGAKMCANIEDVKDAQAVYADIEKEVCAVCPHAAGCAYIAQKGMDADFWIVSHNALFSETPAAINARGVGAVVIDESFFQSGLIGTEGRGLNIPLDALLPAAGMAAPPGLDGQRLKAIREDLAKALLDEPDGYVNAEALSRANIQTDTAGFAREGEWARKINKRQEQDWRDRQANRDLGRMVALWRAIEHLKNTEGLEVSGRLRLTTQEGVRSIYVYGRADIAAGWRAPTLCIDALHKPELIEPFLGKVEDKGALPVRAPHQMIRQAVHKSWAKTYLDPEMGDGDTPQKRDNRRRAKAGIIEQAARIGGRVLLIGSKNVVLDMKRTGLPPEIEVAWFGAVAGRDAWRDVRGVIILGAPSPTSGDVERAAGALSGRAPSPVGTPDGRFPKADALRFKRDGHSVVAIPAEDKRHPDELAETIRQHITLGQIEQALGRGRGVRRGPANPVEVIVLSDAALPFPVDDFLPESAVTPSHRALQIAEGGIAFEDGTSAATAYPELYPSPGAAREAFRHEKAVAQKASSGSLIGISIRDTDGAFAVAFQKAGNGQRLQRAWAHPSFCPDPKTAIEARLGLLARFEVIEEEEIAVPVAVGAEAMPLAIDYREEAHRPLPELLAEAIAPEAPPEAEALYLRAGLAVLARHCLKLTEAKLAEAANSNTPAQDDEAEEDAFGVGSAWWDKIHATASDCGLRLGDVAAGAGMSFSDFSNCQAGRRRMTKQKAEAVEAFLAAAPRVQGRLL